MQLVGFTPARARVRAITAPHRMAAAVALAACGVVAVNVAISLLLTDGVFTYALDDPYIHLALSEQIARGHYGLFPGVVAAPSSSILWPFLLAPFAGTGLHEWMPLLFNTAAAAATAVMLFLLLRDLVPALRPVWAAGASLVATEVFYVAGIALTGMEHSLQIALTLAATLGFLHIARRQMVPRWLPAVLIAGPLVRYEALAIAVLGAALIAYAGHRRTALVTLGASLLGVVAFSGFLLSLGLDPLPSSVLAKSAAGSEAGAGGAFLQLVGGTIMSMVNKPGLWLLLGVLGVVAVKGGKDRPLYLLGCATLLGNLVLAASPLRRYDIHLLMVAGPLLVYAWTTVERGRVWRAAALVAGVLATWHYGLTAAQTPASAQEIHLQQRQMGNFVAEQLREPVAVNDLGFVALRSEHEVLDLWGLGNAEARRARLAKDDAWIGEVVDRHGVDVAMIYEHWFEGNIPTTWTRVARLRLDDPLRQVVGGRDVAFFATTPAAEPRLRAALARFADTLPPGATLVSDPDHGQ